MASQDTAEPTPGRTAYDKPILAKYGQLKDLTTGGTGNANEASSGKKPRP